MFRHSGVGRRFSGQCSCSDNGFVEVIVTEQKPTFFMKIVNWESAAVQARAVAGAVPFTQYPCIIALNPTAEGAPDGAGNRESAVAPTCDGQMSR